MEANGLCDNHGKDQGNRLFQPLVFHYHRTRVNRGGNNILDGPRVYLVFLRSTFVALKKVIPSKFSIPFKIFFDPIRL